MIVTGEALTMDCLRTNVLIGQQFAEGMKLPPPCPPDYKPPEMDSFWGCCAVLFIFGFAILCLYIEVTTRDAEDERKAEEHRLRKERKAEKIRQIVRDELARQYEKTVVETSTG